MTDEIYVVERKENMKKQRRVAFEDESAAREWLESELDTDILIDSWTVAQFAKTVYTDQHDAVVGTIEAVELVEQTPGVVDDAVSQERGSA